MKTSKPDFAKRAKTRFAQIVPAVTTFVALTFSLAAHAGTGGGNGDFTSSADYERMKSEATFDLRRVPALPRSVEQVKATDVEVLYLWCDEIISFLDRWWNRANIQAQRDRYGLANQMLMRAISLSIHKIEMDPNQASPLTLRLLRRGEKIAAVLEREVSDSEDQGKLTKFEFLKDYVQFVIRQSNELDRKLVIPYYYTYGGCNANCPPEFDMLQFEHAYLEAAKEQLQFAVKHFTYKAQRNDELEYGPKGNRKVFFYLARLLAEGVASDVAQTLSAYANACTIRDLRLLASKLPDPSLPSDDYLDYGHQTDQVAKELMKIGKRISDGECRGSFAIPAVK